MSSNSSPVDNSEHSEGATSFSFWVAVCFTLNYIIGTGFLTLPWAFHQAGYVLGSLILIIMTGFSVIAVIFILEAMARANEFKNRRLSSNDPNIQFSTILRGGNSYNNSYQTIQMGARSAFDGGGGGDDEIPDNKPMVKNVKFELTELCEIFMGKTGRTVYTFVIAIYMYGTLWCYSTVFSKACSSHLSIGEENSYTFYLILFALIVVPASCMELSEQITVQVTLSICRILMVLLMVGTVFYAEGTDYASFGDFQQQAHTDSDLWNFEKIYLLLPVAAYANIFHHSIPALSHPVGDKLRLAGIFSTALWISMAAYMLLGITIASYFGGATQISSNLNWHLYHGHVIRNSDAYPWYARAVSFYVVLFPAFDVASAFPLNAITLGNSLMSNHFGQDMQVAEKDTKNVRFFRCLAAIPPIFAAYFVSNIGTITDYTGITGFAIAFSIPALLAYFSEKLCKQVGIPHITVYSSPYLGKIAQFATVAVGLFMFVFVLSSLLFIGPPPSEGER